MMIPREVVEEVRRRTDIVELIGSYVTLKRAGSNYNGLCPFHSEKTPSFTVFPDSESFYCFGCGAGGDCVTFVMKNDNLDYPSAVEVLANRAGITLTREKENNPGGLTRKRVHDMNRDAANFFHQCLLSPAGAEGLKYLTEKRRLSMALIKHFGLGFAPGSWNMLTDYMLKKGYTEKELAQGFLCGISQKNGRAYDYFRNRVIFPIIDTAGNVIAFGGRVMDDSKPKYLNSSDTPAFQKRKNLFALNFAKNYATDRLILCEGYMDVISLHAFGFENAVATTPTRQASEPPSRPWRCWGRLVWTCACCTSTMPRTPTSISINSEPPASADWWREATPSSRISRIRSLQNTAWISPRSALRLPQSSAS